MTERLPEYGQTNIREKRLLIAWAWGIMLIISELPDILLDSFSMHELEWLSHVKTVLLLIFLVSCFVWKKISSLWQYGIILLVFHLSLSFSNWVGTTGWWSNLFADSKSSFTFSYLELYIRDFGIALAVIAALWIIKKQRKNFFFTKGNLKAPIDKVVWLGIRQGESWRTFGWIFAIFASAAVCIPVFLSIQPTSSLINKMLPLLPAVFLFSAINAFNEEIYFRVSILSTLSEIIGKSNILLLSSVFFGLAHYLHGSPPGIVGFLMTGFLAWILGKSILETKGIFWAWFIHFVPDVIIFISYALFWSNT